MEKEKDPNNPNVPNQPVEPIKKEEEKPLKYEEDELAEDSPEQSHEIKQHREDDPFTFLPFGGE
jgi:hypothetical protein